MAPTARRRQLGSWLRKLRIDAGNSTNDAADVLGCSEAKIRHWESGRSGAKKVELERLLQHYGAEDEVCEQLEETRRDGAKRGWWSSYKLPLWFAPYVGLETDAAEVCNFELDLVPGLLQTEEYAREVHRVGPATLDEDVIEKFVAVRMARQQRLTGDPPLKVRLVIAEEALHRVVRTPKVMHDQMERILELGDLRNVIVQVLPFEAGAHVSPHGPISVLRFNEPDADDIGYTDTPLSGHIIDDAEDVALMRNLFDELRSVSLPAPESADLLRTMSTRYNT